MFLKQHSCQKEAKYFIWFSTKQTAIYSNAGRNASWVGYIERDYSMHRTMYFMGYLKDFWMGYFD